MKDIDKIQSAINDLNTNYPRPRIGLIAIDGQYDLENDWPKAYPNVKSAGVYILLDSNNSLLYVGKTSCDSSFGKRFNQYFMYGEDKKYKVKNKYYAEVKKILTIPLPSGHEFEASAIEEFLIQKLNPRLNKIGRNKI